MAEPNSSLANGHERLASDATFVGQNNVSSPSSSPQTSMFVTAQSAATPPIIPPEHPSRTLVLCFDGTGDQYAVSNLRYNMLTVYFQV